MEIGGLRFQRVWGFNQALKDKWQEKLHVYREGLWYKVLETKFEVEGGCIKEWASREWGEVISLELDNDGDEFGLMVR